MLFKKLLTITSTKKQIIATVLLALILLLALYLRISWILHIEQLEVSIGFDGQKYDHIARNLLENQNFGYEPHTPSSWRPPGYPFMLYAVYSLFGYNPFIIRILQCFMGAGICLLLYKLTRLLMKNMPYRLTISLLTALLYALNFYSIFINQYLYVELFHSLLIVLTIYLLYRADDSTRQSFYTYIILAAFSLWYAALTRPETLTFAVWAGIWLMVRNKKKESPTLKGFGVIVLIFCLTILPWTIRNYYVHKRLLPISTSGGLAFFVAHHPQSNGGKLLVNDNLYTAEQLKELNNLSEVQKQDKHFQYAFDFIKNNPGKELKLIFLKQKLLWTKAHTTLIFIDFLPLWPTLPLTTFHFLLIFAIPGFIFLLIKKELFSLPIIYIANFAAVFSLFYYYDGIRIRAALFPLLSIFAAVGIVFLIAKLLAIFVPKNQ